MQDNPLLIRIGSFFIAICIHAAVLFAGGVFEPNQLGGGGGGDMNVDLVGGPPGEEPPPPPPPPAAEQETMPQPPPEQEMEPEIPPPDQMVMPDLDAEQKPEPPKKVDQYYSPVYATNAMSAEERERSIRFLKQMGRPGTGHVGSTPGAMGGGGGGGGAGGGRWGIGGCKVCPEPVYPIEARKMKQVGTVRFGVLVGAEGSIQSVVIKSTSGHVLLDQAVQRAVKKWVIEPKKIAGVPVPTAFEGEITFQLANSQ